jgi:hypothetical protein
MKVVSTNGECDKVNSIKIRALKMGVGKVCYIKSCALKMGVARCVLLRCEH